MKQKSLKQQSQGLLLLQISLLIGRDTYVQQVYQKKIEMNYNNDKEIPIIPYGRKGRGSKEYINSSQKLNFPSSERNDSSSYTETYIESKSTETKSTKKGA